MKRFLLCATLFISCVGFALAGGSAEVPSFRTGDRAWVSAKTLALKASTSAFASSTANLNYGAQVNVLGVSGNWIQVEASTNAKLSGWASASSFTTKKITAANSTGATASEIALAGKGFNEEVENAYAAQEGSKVDYSEVDKVEANTVQSSQLKDFINQGHLKGGN
jgi:hypothetical protein